MILDIRKILTTYGANKIFEGLDFKVNAGDRIGLVGPNGCGKTTLLKIIAGQLEPDKGSVYLAKDSKVAYLPQQPILQEDKTVIEHLHSSHEDILKLQRRLRIEAENMKKLPENELKAAINKYDRLMAEFEIAGGYDYEIKIREISAGLGLDEKFHNNTVSTLSGGQLSRLGLAKVLLADAKMLLLDEPTNHLDWQAVLWLQNFLRNYNGAFILVSHDRFLLDKLTNKTAEIANYKIKMYGGNYTTYKEEKEKQKLQLDRQYEKRSRFVEHTRDFIDRNRQQEGMSKVARGRKKYLERILKNDPSFLEKSAQDKELDFEFDEVESKGQRSDYLITCEKLSKRFDSLVLFENLDFELLTGQKLGIIGPNGTGKTTLLKILLEQTESTEGFAKIKKNQSIAYIDQTGSELNGDNTVLQEAAIVSPKLSNEQIRGRLGAFLFSGDDVFKKIEDLSGGEKNRLALYKAVFRSPDILILDEPTNHLDIPSIEALEQALFNYSGTVIIVSHDRFFLDKIVDKLLVIGVDGLGRKCLGKFEFIDGNVSDYFELIEDRQAEEKALSNKKSNAGKQKTPKKTTPQHLRQFNSWKIEQIESRIEETEHKIAELQEQFGEEKIYKDPSLHTKLQQEYDEKHQYLDLLYEAYELRLK